jgi:glycosyltransferase involved in cell wall biosynthesis
MNSICFIGMDNYPMMNPQYDASYIGGESVQQTLLAKEFTKKNYNVSMIVNDFGQPFAEKRENINIYRINGRRNGLPVIRFFHPKLTSVIKALKTANADIYYQSCAGQMSGIVAWYCWRNNRKFVFRIAHDLDCIPNKQLISLRRDKKIFEYGLRRADLIAAQSHRQAELLKIHYGLESTVINMVAEVPSAGRRPAKQTDVLWVNNLRPFKRPEVFLEIASRLPKFRFRMIGGPCSGMGDYYAQIKARSESMANFEFLGHVPYAQVNDHFAGTRLFVNTSEVEGFPNTFLQAWIRGVPVLSFFDPDGLIEQHRIGRSPATMEDMVQAINELLTAGSQREAISGRAMEFARSQYSPRAVANEYDHLFQRYQAGLRP